MEGGAFRGSLQGNAQSPTTARLGKYAKVRNFIRQKHFNLSPVIFNHIFTENQMNKSGNLLLRVNVGDIFLQWAGYCYWSKCFCFPTGPLNTTFYLYSSNNKHQNMDLVMNHSMYLGKKKIIYINFHNTSSHCCIF